MDPGTDMPLRTTPNDRTQIPIFSLGRSTSHPVPSVFPLNPQLKLLAGDLSTAQRMLASDKFLPKVEWFLATGTAPA